MEYLFNELYQDLRNFTIDYISYEYDYCYMKSMLRLNGIMKPEVIVLGCSHARNGICEDVFPYKVINMSSASQDLHISKLLLDKIMVDNNRLKYCVVNIGYWGLYQELSKQVNEGHLLQDRYYPILKLNEYSPIDSFSKLKSIQNRYSNLFNTMSKGTIKLFADDWSDSYFIKQKGYFGLNKNRANSPNTESTGKLWKELDDASRNRIGRARANAHNKFVKYNESLATNRDILNEMIYLLVENNIKPIISIFPFSREYIKYIDVRYKDEIVSTLNELENEIYFLDMNDYGEFFEVADFIDADHLDDSGAKKSSVLLNEFIRQI